MANLVEYIKGEPMTTSDLIAKEFGIAHNELLVKIRNLSAEIPLVRFDKMYKESERLVRGREFKTYLMNRDGYMFLVMNISTKKAHTKKLAFIDAFNAMENALLTADENRNDVEWLKLEQQSKEIRREETDVIKSFIEYAKNQGSKNSGHYYGNYTKATYRALRFVQHKKPKLKATLDMLELSQLMVAENLAKQSIKKHMEEGEHYKVVFELVKQDLINFADGLFLTNTTGK